MSTDALASLVWQRFIAVDDINLANFGTIDMKRTGHVAAVARDLQTFAGGPLADDDVDVKMWGYRLYSERPYVTNLCSFTDEDLVTWRSHYMVQADALCWNSVTY